jgi:oligoendopeptidase F
MKNGAKKVAAPKKKAAKEPAARKVAKQVAAREPAARKPVKKGASARAEVRLRHEVPLKDRWDLDRVYPTEAAYEADLERMHKLHGELAAQQGKLTSAAAYAAFLHKQDDYYRTLEKLAVYARHRADEDTSNTANQARKSKLMATITQLEAALAWVEPELLALPAATLTAWENDPSLAEYRRTVKLLARRKPHTLSAAEETIISQAGEIFSLPYETFTLFTSADLKLPDAKDKAGRKHTMSMTRFVPLMMSTDRELRRSAFSSMWDTLGGFRNTLASLLLANVKTHNMNARVRKFPSALAAAVFPDNIPESLPRSLVKAVHEGLPVFHKYVSLRAERLGLKPLDMFDMYVPIVPDFELDVPYGQAVEWIREAMKPMGEEYCAAVDECFSNRWVDVYENKGKIGGAYSGGCYDTMPYILLNYQNRLDDAFTLAHELGHSVHSWMSRKYQKPRYADYTIFVAEIASTTAEALLHHYLMEKATDPRLRAYLLNHYCDGFRGTVFRQTMFSEFETLIHEADQNGTPLTADWLEEQYYALNAKYFGKAVAADRRIGMEWARIPHFYYNFYVYKYATGHCAAQIFAQRILQGGASLEAYLGMLKMGGSADPLDEVRSGGVDLEDPKVYHEAFALFGAAIRELRKTLGKL